MERPRSKRKSHYFHPDHDNQTVTRTKHSYNGRCYGNRPPKPPQDPQVAASTSYRILCLDTQAGGVIGKSGSIIKSIRQQTGTWISVHELVPGDDERIIEITDAHQWEDGRHPFSSAHEALLMVHDRILECGVSGSGKVTTRLVVSRTHVGCLMGKGGKIIEQMRIETKTQIRILPREHNLPRCVSMSEEIVQVIGDVNAVRNAVAIIASRLRESQLRNHHPFYGQPLSTDEFVLDDNHIPLTGNATQRLCTDDASFGLQLSTIKQRNFSYTQKPADLCKPAADDLRFLHSEQLIFKILCPCDRVNRIIGKDGIVELLQNKVGVDVKVAKSDCGLDEQVITVASEEELDDVLFPAQEALLHIQTHIIDLNQGEGDRVKTRLLVQPYEAEYLDGKNEFLQDIERSTGANLQILQIDKPNSYVSQTGEILQIEGEIRSARSALVEVTSRMRHYICTLSQNGTLPPISTLGARKLTGVDTLSPNSYTPPRERESSMDPSVLAPKNTHLMETTQYMKDSGGLALERTKHCEDAVSLNRIAVPIVTKSILEVVIPEQAAQKLIMNSRNKLVQISKLSKANVILLEERQDLKDKVIQISGTPDQAERAQSLLQGFILSTQEDGI